MDKKKERERETIVALHQREWTLYREVKRRKEEKRREKKNRGGASFYHIEAHALPGY